MVTVCSVLYPECVGKMIKDPQYQSRHQTLVFSSERWQQLQPPAWLSAPKCGTGFLKQDPQNERSAKAPLPQERCGLCSGPCRWWRSPVGLRTQRWLQQGLKLVETIHRWSRRPGSPKGHSNKRSSRWCNKRIDPVAPMASFTRVLPYWWLETVCRPPEHHQASDRSPPLLL